jgi:hypothetical protein
MADLGRGWVSIFWIRIYIFLIFFKGILAPFKNNLLEKYSRKFLFDPISTSGVESMDEIKGNRAHCGYLVEKIRKWYSIVFDCEGYKVELDLLKTTVLELFFSLKIIVLKQINK